MKPRLKPLPNHTMGSTGQETEEVKARLSLAKCRELLKTESSNLSDEQVLAIRDYMYRLAAIGWEQYQYDQQQTKVLHLEERKTTTDENSHYLRTG